MRKVDKDEMNQIAHLFNGIEDSMIIACLQGYLGDAWVDELPEPSFGLIVSGEYSFFGGDAGDDGVDKMIEELFVCYVAGNETTAIYADENAAWGELLLRIKRNSPKKVARFGIVQRDYEFDKILLQNMIDSLPETFNMVPFDKDIYEQAISEDWSAEFCEIFNDMEDYLKRGFGYAVLLEGRLIAGTSTMTVYDGGTEIQVATRPEFRRRGLALPTSAAFLMECMKRNIRPCWDAANETSLHMALKLGYEYRGEYATVVMHR
jgi:GNAT superfamily N-acetyltransferase